MSLATLNPQNTTSSALSLLEPYYPCPYCGKELPFHSLVNVILPIPYSLDNPVAFYEPCDCPRAVAEREAYREKQLREEDWKQREESRKRATERATKASILGKKYADASFETAKLTPDNKYAYEKAEAYCDDFLKYARGERDLPQKSLYIAGNYGTGKTHLAYCVRNLLVAHNVPVLLCTGAELLDGIREELTTSREKKLLDLACKVSLLILDDFAKESPTVWSNGTLFEIINRRYNDNLPTLYTSNYGIPDTRNRLTPSNGDSSNADAICDRLRETCLGLVLAGPSLRTPAAREKA